MFSHGSICEILVGSLSILIVDGGGQAPVLIQENFLYWKLKF